MQKNQARIAEELVQVELKAIKKVKKKWDPGYLKFSFGFFFGVISFILVFFLELSAMTPTNRNEYLDDVFKNPLKLLKNPVLIFALLNLLLSVYTLVLSPFLFSFSLEMHNGKKQKFGSILLFTTQRKERFDNFFNELSRIVTTLNRDLSGVGDIKGG